MADFDCRIVSTRHSHICTCYRWNNQVKIPTLFFLTVTGSITWILSFVLGGYFIGSRPFLKPWLKYNVISFILFVTIPLVVRIVKEFRKQREEPDDKN